jgi:uncharacterized membrane protein YfcA
MLVGFEPHPMKATSDADIELDPQPDGGSPKCVIYCRELLPPPELCCVRNSSRSRCFTLSIVPGRATTSTGGFGAGIFNGLAEMPGPLAVAYYLSVPLTREAARASLLVFFLMTSITAMAASMIAGLLTPQTVALSVLGLPVMWIGTRLGEIAFSRGTSDMHRRVSIVVLNVIAIIGAVQGMREIA